MDRQIVRSVIQRNLPKTMSLKIRILRIDTFKFFEDEIFNASRRNKMQNLSGSFYYIRIHLFIMKERGDNRTARRNKHVASSVVTVIKAMTEDMLNDLIDKKNNPLVLILDCIQDPHNLGAILRTADAAGVDVVIAPKDKSVGITDTVLRVSVGAAEHVPFIQVTNLARTMRFLKEKGFWIVGTSDQGDRTLYDMDLKGPTVLVMGAEGDGMRRLTSENCDFLVRIPMRGIVPCLNVSVATGVCLYEILRQRL